MNDDRVHYESYLLRLWRDDADELLHASLQSTDSDSIFHLKDLNALLTFLSAKQPAASSCRDAETNTD